MNIHNFTNRFDDLKTEYKSEYLSRVITQLIENNDPDARFVLDELLINLQDLEADDYFGSEGYKD